MSSTSAAVAIAPDEQDVKGGSIGYGSAESSGSRSPLASFPFLKSLGGDKKTTRDGQAPKRRGPKPDSKPALTRRQELNRQAQRTHRERKEMYIKALEEEVLRLKETFGTTARERDALAEENRKLRELLATHGITVDLSNPRTPFGRGISYGESSGSISGSYAAPSSATEYSPPPMPGQTVGQMGRQNEDRLQRNRVDYDQVGIDFVLTLERPCMDHMQFLMVRSNESEVDISGHALMATCPPSSHIVEHPNEPYPHKMPEMGMADLTKLLDLSNRLPLDGEITPVMAWAMIYRNQRVAELDVKDFETIKCELSAKVRCYGFGAVLEEFEVEDAISNALAMKADTFPTYMVQSQIAVA